MTWIKCDYEMPEVREGHHSSAYVLVATPHGGVHYACWFPRHITDEGEPFPGFWSGPQILVNHGHGWPTHWMPLPPAPEKEVGVDHV